MLSYHMFCGTDDIHILSLELQRTYRKKFQSETIHSHVMIKTGTSLKASVFNHIRKLGFEATATNTFYGIFLHGPMEAISPN